MKHLNYINIKLLLGLFLLTGLNQSVSGQLLPGNLYGQMTVGAGDPWALIHGDLKIMSTGELFLGTHAPRGLQINQLGIAGNYIGEAGSRVYISINDNSNAPGSRGYIDIIGTATKTDGATTVELDAFNANTGWNGACIDLIRANAAGSDPGTFQMLEHTLNDRIGVLRHRYYNQDLIWFFAEKLVLSQRTETQTTCRNAGFNPLAIIVAPGEYSYQWYRCNEQGDENSFVILPNENGQYFTPPSNTIGTSYYRCIVTSLSCNYNIDTTAVSGAMIVSGSVRIITQPEGEIVIHNGAPADILLSVEAENAVSYQWFKNGVAIANSNSSEITIDLGSTQDKYYVEVSGCGETIVSEIATIGFCLDIIVQKRNHTLAVNNNSDTNGGYKFVHFRWYKNGELINEGDAPNNYADHYYSGSDNLDFNALYYVELMTADGSRFVSCEFQPSWQGATPSIQVYPNPVTFVSSGKVTLEVFDLENENDLDNANITVYSASGQMVMKSKANGRKTEVQMPSTPGVYIIRLNSETISTDAKVIVK